MESNNAIDLGDPSILAAFIHGKEIFEESLTASIEEIFEAGSEDEDVELPDDELATPPPLTTSPYQNK